MKIKYRIIWFEDDKKWLKSAIPFVEENLTDKGFEPIIDIFESVRKIPQSLWNKINRSDVIVMDLKLRKGFSGDKIIRQIRDNNVLTEVVFYSSDGEDKLRKLIHGERLDGIYCSEREGSWKKVNEVIDMNIQKAQDVNGLRGLVMAEEAELQNITAQVLWELHKNKHTLASFIRKHAHDKTTKHFTDTLKLLEEINPERHYEKLFEMHEYGASGKQITLSAFLKEIVKSKNVFKPMHAVMKNYTNEIITPRNDLAHSVEKEIGNKIFLINKKRGKIEFTEAECIKIRKNLQKHRKNLKTILDLVEKDSRSTQKRSFRKHR